MPRSAAVAVENSFKSGLMTEATGLNFPENACTDTNNCVFNYDGSVQRRLGYDFEDSFTEKTIDRTNNVVTTYLWKNVTGDGNVSLLVVQVGATLYFYETDGDSISGGAISDTVDLTTYLASGAPAANTQECQFASGNGLLFVTHPYCEALYVSYDTSTQAVTETQIDLKIRDVEGDTQDTLEVDDRPTDTVATLDPEHHYNLLNQGFRAGDLSDWEAEAHNHMPSNADVVWSFRDSTNDLDFSAGSLKKVLSGNTPAPKGHYILSLYDQDREAISGVTGATNATTSYFRPSTCSFFAGRVFYSGINYVGFNSRIYFSQIVENPNQYGKCFQQQDPTSESNFDLLASDGGVINIQEAGTIYKLVSVPGGLVVFGANGIWMISGSSGIGFTATDYTVSKVSSISTLSATSFVDVGGFPAWWNAEGIYILTSDGATPKIESLTDQRIKTYYDAIPYTSKLQSRGYFNLVEGVIQWLFRSTESGTPEETYEYDRILNFNVATGAFYPWDIPDGDVTVNSIIVLEGSSGALTAQNVVNDSGDLVVNDSGDQIIAYSTANTASGPRFLYLCSYAASGSYRFTFGLSRDTGYLDWVSYDDGSDFTSYFITGYKLHGEGIKKFQSNWVKVFSRNDQPTSYYIQNVWDYANTGSGTGRWSSQQLVSHDDSNYDTMERRLKIRGHGIALQLKVTSVSTMPFDVIGWIIFDTGNTLP